MTATVEMPQYRSRIVEFLSESPTWLARPWLVSPKTALATLLTLLAGCVEPSRPPPRPVITSLGSFDNVAVEIQTFEDAPGNIPTGRVRLLTPIDSVAAFQLVISAPTSVLTGIELSNSTFEPAKPDDSVSTNRSMASGVSLYRIFPVTKDRFPAWYLRSVGSSHRREFFDALVPINAPHHGQPFTISAGGQLPIWGEVKIPKGAQPGEYRSAISISGTRGELARVPIDLLVRSVVLPDERNLPVLAGVQLAPVLGVHSNVDPGNLCASMANADACNTVRTIFHLLHEHGLSPYSDEIHPPFFQDVDGTLKIDWTSYDAFCGPLIDGSTYADHRPAAGWPLPINMQQPDPIQYDGVQSSAYAEVLKAYHTAVRDHFQAKGWLGHAWLWLDLAAGPQPSAGELADLRRIASCLHRSPTTTSSPALSPTPFVSTLIPQSMTPFGWLDFHHDDVAAVVDIWATPARYEHRPTLAQQKAAGKRIWLSPGQPPFSASLAVEAPTTHARSLPWQAFLQGSDAIIIRATTQWPDKVFDQDIHALRSDTWLVYPGDMFGLTEPVASLRLKQLQLGLQDYELLHMLEAHDRGQTARLLAGSLIKACGTETYGDNFLDGLFGRRVDDPRAWQLGHDLLLEEVAAAVLDSGVHGQSDDPAANRGAWAKFLSATRHVEVTPESTRVAITHRAAIERNGSSQRPVDDAVAGRSRSRRILTITHEIAVRSELRIDIQGALKLGPLPPGGHDLKDSVPIGPLTEMGLARRPLGWELDGPLPCDLDGHYSQPIIFDAPEAGQLQASAILSIVQAPPASRPVTIDGDVSEWLPNEYNAAGDFRLITAPTIAKAQASNAEPSSNGKPQTSPVKPISMSDASSLADRPRAASQTIAYFCRDADFLYVAIHAASPEADAARERRITSEIEYEDLAPVGEDLVEVLLDPTNSGTLSDDLYHLVIKSNGIGVFEKGIRMTPAIGRSTPWPGPAPRYAVVRTDYGWSAEIAIPLATLGLPGRSTVWGLNVARAEPRRGEYSDWSRAPRYCYDPRTLGNLLWPE